MIGTDSACGKLLDGLEVGRRLRLAAAVQPPLGCTCKLCQPTPSSCLLQACSTTTCAMPCPVGCIAACPRL